MAANRSFHLPNLPRDQRRMLWVACIVAAGAVLIAPIGPIEALVTRSGLPHLIPAAAPPLGWSARASLALIAALAAAAIVIAIASLTDRPARLSMDKPVGAVPKIRRADAHPDANPRAPLFAARDLGEGIGEADESADPFASETETNAIPVWLRDAEMTSDHREPPVERALPHDWDQPLAYYDPAAIQPNPRARSEPVAALARPDPLPIRGENRSDPFEAVSPARTAPAPSDISGEMDEVEKVETVQGIAMDARDAFDRKAPRDETRGAHSSDTDATIHALLERLERGVAQRRHGRPQPPSAPVAPPPAPAPTPAPATGQGSRGLRDTLDELRRMAMAD